MTLYTSEAKAFTAGGDETAALCQQGKPNCGFRVLREGELYKVIMVPARGNGLPYYL